MSDQDKQKKTEPDEDFDSFVVFDCDIGTDDAWALAMILKAEAYGGNFKAGQVPPALKPGKLKVAGITCVQGNTSVDNAALNALRMLTLLDRLDVPVYKGSAEPVLPRVWSSNENFHGNDGLGDIQGYPQVDEALICQEHAANAMYRLACQHAHKVDFILLGPLTNFAMAINLYGNELLSKIRNIFIMGGNIRAKGNVTKSAEFNFMMDPEAAHIVMERVRKPVWLLPWETCIDGEFGLTMDWRLNVLGAVPSGFMELLNRAEREVLLKRGYTKWLTSDALLLACYLFPDHLIKDQVEYSASVEISGRHTRGQVVLDHLRGSLVDELHGKDVNVRFITKLYPENYKRVIAWTGGLEDVCIEDMWRVEQPQT